MCYPDHNYLLGLLQEMLLFATIQLMGTICTMAYYLADGIYPPRATLVKIIPHPKGKKNIYFAQRQEAWKDVEGACGVL